MRQITLPSGMTGKIRGISLGRLNALMKDKATANDPGGWMEPIITNTWLETLDHGIYDAAKFNWMDALIADRAAAIIAAAAETYGPMFPISIQCPGCTKAYEWDINLTELETSPFSAEVLAKLAIGNNDFTTEVRGRTVHFVIPTGKTEATLMGYGKKKKKKDEDPEPPGAMDLVMCRILGVDGADTPEEVRAFFEDLEMWEVEELQSALDAFDGGVQTMVETECPRAECEEVARVQLPFGPTLFRPRKGLVVRLQPEPGQRR